jgi:hypothetical protein
MQLPMFSRLYQRFNDLVNNALSNMNIDFHTALILFYDGDEFISNRFVKVTLEAKMR